MAAEIIYMVHYEFKKEKKAVPEGKEVNVSLPLLEKNIETTNVVKNKIREAIKEDAKQFGDGYVRFVGIELSDIGKKRWELVSEKE